jgi:hypothetical protein
MAGEFAEEVFDDGRVESEETPSKVSRPGQEVGLECGIRQKLEHE